MKLDLSQKEMRSQELLKILLYCGLAWNSEHTSDKVAYIVLHLKYHYL